MKQFKTNVCGYPSHNANRSQLGLEHIWNKISVDRFDIKCSGVVWEVVQMEPEDWCSVGRVEVDFILAIWPVK